MQVLLVITAWGLLMKLNEPGSLVIQDIPVVRAATVWQASVTVALVYILCKIFVNAVRNLGVEAGNLDDNLYTALFFHATQIATALDAGFWSAMVFNDGWKR